MIKFVSGLRIHIKSETT